MVANVIKLFVSETVSWGIGHWCFIEGFYRKVKYCIICAFVENLFRFLTRCGSHNLTCLEGLILVN